MGKQLNFHNGKAMKNDLLDATFVARAVAHALQISHRKISKRCLWIQYR